MDWLDAHYPHSYRSAVVDDDWFNVPMRWLGFDGIPRIIFVDLGVSSITDDELANISRLKRLRFVSFADTTISDVGLIHLRKCHNLEFLDLGWTDVDGTGFVHVNHLPHLRRIWLTDTQVDDDGLRHLEVLNQIDEIQLYDCADVTQRGIRALHAGHPDCAIYLYTKEAPLTGRRRAIDD